MNLRALIICLICVAMPDHSKAQSQDDLDRKAMIEALDAAATPAQLSRKARSIEQLKSMDIPVLDSLPVIAGVSDSTRRSSAEVAERALALMLVALKGETLDQQLVDHATQHFEARSYFTPRERAFMQDLDVDPQTRAAMTWRYESVAVLLWSLHLLDDLPPPDTIIDASLLGDIFRELGPRGLKDQARLRPQSQILEAADLAYRINWAAVQARVSDTPMPDALHPSIAHERHYALNWLYGYADLSWDDMRTDT